MDAKGVRIFCEMAFKDLILGPSRHASPSEIGRKLGLDEKTVRIRVRKMEESGFIKYYQATPNLALLGMKYQGLCRFEAMNVPTKFGVLKYIQPLFGILEAWDYLGSAVTISMTGASRSDISAITDRIATQFELSKTSLGDHELSSALGRLDQLDWRIIEKLRYDAHATAKEVSDTLEITQRMAMYRIEKLIDSGALQIRPVTNMKSQQGIVFYEIGVSTDSSYQSAVRRKLQETHGEKMWSLRVAPNGMLMVDLFGFTLADPEESAMELQSVEGVKWCSISVLKEVIEPNRPNWIDQLIHEKIGNSDIDK